MNELVGKVAVITGGASGIGAATSRVFAEEGASVVVADIHAERTEKVVQSIQVKGGTALAVAADVSSDNGVERTIKATLRRFGRIDILVNNAGIGSRTGALTTPGDLMVENLTEQSWDRVMIVNLKSQFLCSRAVIPIMKKQRSGNIINIASVAAFTGAGIEMTWGSGAHYHVSKAGVVNLTKTLAVQLGPYGIRANSIAPGMTYGADPDGTQSAGFGVKPEDTEKAIRMIPIGRLGTPTDIANAALFLASDKSSYVHGVTLNVNGGLVIV